jgi:hypothetical protein
MGYILAMLGGRIEVLVIKTDKKKVVSPPSSIDCPPFEMD